MNFSIGLASIFYLFYFFLENMVTKCIPRMKRSCEKFAPIPHPVIPVLLNNLPSLSSLSNPYSLFQIQF